MVYVMGVQIGMAIALDRVLGGGFPEVGPKPPEQITTSAMERR